MSEDCMKRSLGADSHLRMPTLIGKALFKEAEREPNRLTETSETRLEL